MGLSPGPKIKKMGVQWVQTKHGPRGLNPLDFEFGSEGN